MHHEGHRKLSVYNQFGYKDVYKNKNYLASILIGMALACSSVFCIKEIQLLQLYCKYVATGAVDDSLFYP